MEDGLEFEHLEFLPRPSSKGQPAPAVAVRRGRNERQVRGRTNVPDGYYVPLKLGGTSARRPSKLKGWPCSTDLLRIVIGKRCEDFAHHHEMIQPALRSQYDIFRNSETLFY
jgi:hypothetical protein